MLWKEWSDAAHPRELVLFDEEPKALKKTPLTEDWLSASETNASLAQADQRTSSAETRFFYVDKSLIEKD